MDKDDINYQMQVLMVEEQQARKRKQQISFHRSDHHYGQHQDEAMSLSVKSNRSSNDSLTASITQVLHQLEMSDVENEALTHELEALQQELRSKDEKYEQLKESYMQFRVRVCDWVDSIIQSKTEELASVENQLKESEATAKERVQQYLELKTYIEAFKKGVDERLDVLVSMKDEKYASLYKELQAVEAKLLTLHHAMDAWTGAIDPILVQANIHIDPFPAPNDVVGAVVARRASSSSSSSSLAARQNAAEQLRNLFAGHLYQQRRNHSNNRQNHPPHNNNNNNNNNNARCGATVISEDEYSNSTKTYASPSVKSRKSDYTSPSFTRKTTTSYHPLGNQSRSGDSILEEGYCLEETHHKQETQNNHTNHTAAGDNNNNNNNNDDDDKEGLLSNNYNMDFDFGDYLNDLVNIDQELVAVDMSLGFSNFDNNDINSSTNDNNKASSSSNGFD